MIVTTIILEFIYVNYQYFLYLSETINIVVKLILENKKDLTFLENELTKLFYFTTWQTHFYFDRETLVQVDGVAMASLLGLAFPNFVYGFEDLIMVDIMSFTSGMWTIFFVSFKTNIRLWLF